MISSTTIPDLTDQHKLYGKWFNDTTPWVEKAKKITESTCSFFSSYKPLPYVCEFPHAFILGGGLRTVNSAVHFVHNLQQNDYKRACYALLQTSFYIASSACLIFAYPVGLLALSSADFCTTAVDLVDHLKNQKYLQIVEDLLKLVNNALYFSFVVCFSYYGIPTALVTTLLLSSVRMQAFLGICFSLKAFAQKNKLETMAHLNLGFIYFIYACIFNVLLSATLKKTIILNVGNNFII